jgi:sulfotransferase
MSRSGMVGYALNALKQGMHSGESGRLLLLPYDTLTQEPAYAMEAIYAFTGLTPFRHDFAAVHFDASEFDARLGTPGLHDVRPQVRAPIERETILPPDLWAFYEGASIWRDPAFNRKGVRVL